MVLRVRSVGVMCRDIVRAYCHEVVHAQCHEVVHTGTMPKSLSPAVRSKIIDFDPVAAASISITSFCDSLRISVRSFYNIRTRYDQESTDALHPHLSAPLKPRRVYDDDLNRLRFLAGSIRVPAPGGRAFLG